jgi:hypothetical protein
MASTVSSEIVQYNDYVAGWLDTSIREFLARGPAKVGRSAVALITCLDSDPNPAALLKKNSHLRSALNGVKTVKHGVLVPARLLVEASIREELFVGFDEVWFFAREPVRARPAAAIVGPQRIDQRRLKRLGPWLEANECLLGLGDGNGLNLVIKAQGLVRQVVAKSLFQPERSGGLHPLWVENEEKSPRVNRPDR